MLTEDAQRFADQMSIQLFETSAKDNINVEQVKYTYHILLFIKIAFNFSNDVMYRVYFNNIKV